MKNHILFLILSVFTFSSEVLANSLILDVRKDPSHEIHKTHTMENPLIITDGHEEVQVGRKIGSGGQGEIFEASFHGRDVVVKFMFRTDFLLRGDSAASKSYDMFRLLKKSGFKNTPKLFYIFRSHANKENYMNIYFQYDVIVLEKLKPHNFKPSDCLDLFQDLKFVHSLVYKNKKLVHGDIKPTNIMSKNGRPMFIDFATSEFVMNSYQPSSIETPRKSDIMSLAKSLFDLKHEVVSLDDIDKKDLNGIRDLLGSLDSIDFILWEAIEGRYEDADEVVFALHKLISNNGDLYSYFPYTAMIASGLLGCCLYTFVTKNQ